MIYDPRTFGTGVPVDKNGLVCYTNENRCDTLDYITYNPKSNARSYANASGTLTGGMVTVPAGATSVELVIHSTGATTGGGVASVGPVTQVFTWPGSRGWKDDTGQITLTDWTFSAMTPSTVFEVLWTM
jgi:hypothetical protein